MSPYDPKRTSANASKISIRADTMVSASVSGEIRLPPKAVAQAKSYRITSLAVD